MINNCELVRDLLPLYVDEVCSKTSRTLVEEHLGSCRECGELLAALRSSAPEDMLAAEKDSVIARQAKAFKRKSLTVGMVLACIFAVPILVCLIVNLASAHSLDWFFIVLFSLLVLSSFTVVPLVLAENRGLWTLAAFTASLLGLLAVCCIYTRGHWFFVTASSVLFGLALLFLPFVVRADPAKRLLGRHRGLFVMVADTLLLALMFLAIGLYVDRAGYWISVLAIVPYFLFFAWMIFLAVRYVGKNGWTKAGLCLILVGVCIFCANNVVNRFLGWRLPWPAPQFSVWTPATADGNIKWLLLLSDLVSGTIFAAVGALKKSKENKR